MSIYDEVYGINYKSAQQQMNILVQQITQQGAAGFESLDELEHNVRSHLKKCN